MKRVVRVTVCFLQLVVMLGKINRYDFILRLLTNSSIMVNIHRCHQLIQSIPSLKHTCSRTQHSNWSGERLNTKVDRPIFVSNYMYQVCSKCRLIFSKKKDLIETPLTIECTDSIFLTYIYILRDTSCLSPKK